MAKNFVTVFCAAALFLIVGSLPACTTDNDEPSVPDATTADAVVVSEDVVSSDAAEDVSEPADLEEQSEETEESTDE